MVADSVSGTQGRTVQVTMKIVPLGALASKSVLDLLQHFSEKALFLTIEQWGSSNFPEESLEIEWNL